VEIEEKTGPTKINKHSGRQRVGYEFFRFLTAIREVARNLTEKHLGRVRLAS
jgi:hypothetical protein